MKRSYAWKWIIEDDACVEHGLRTGLILFGVYKPKAINTFIALKVNMRYKTLPVTAPFRPDTFLSRYACGITII